MIASFVVGTLNETFQLYDGKQVMGYWGGPILKYFSQVLIAVHLIGTGTSQVIACAGNNYSIDHSHSKRWVLMQTV